MSRLVLVTGGSRSGKSSYALHLAAPYAHKVFIATAEPTDPEMASRIARHQLERDPSFTLIEEPLDPAAALRAMPANTSVALIDCITVWLGNLFYRKRISNESSGEIDDFLEQLQAPPCHLIVVTNEVGMGIVPADRKTREFRDLAGKINQHLARCAQEVFFLVSGIPVRLKW
ncbi:MAG: bifunctional adenosylcobinamide kinase/adenosylcobinamide-phosphate guanylyltransferase [Deltaproteobacteria bacterium]|nr:bifunctional adenosylcobinamide kinase/adenosylcobinamide-phosphate guanylyltransferase [Deltaproteobacteria bacterium]MBW2071536.1 bifunctional adenosylcobinamide kinase/adenosylcobinamide-phosphate guanylyltransferase [Deltaproteobacteria bacterium]